MISCSFGFAPDPLGHVKIPQLGRVPIGDGSMIDNLVRIGHNGVLARDCALVAQSGISGSSKLADVVMIGESPAVPLTQWLRQTAILNRLATKKDK